MPNYDFLCENCEVVVNVFRGMKETSPEWCSSCGCVMRKMVGTSSPQVMLKGDNWSGKLIKETQIRKRNSEYLDRRQRIEHTSKKALPNVNGEVVDTWKEAKKLAADRGYNTDSYDKFIH